MEGEIDYTSCSSSSSLISCSEPTFGGERNVQVDLMAEATESSANIGRSVRRRSSGMFQVSGSTETLPPAKRRCRLKPQKNLSTPADLEHFYSNEKYKPPTLKSLETIYEEPISKKGGLVFLGPVKPRRFIFSGRVTKEKLKKRKTRVKKLKHVPKKKRITMDTFLTRLYSMMTNEPATNTPEVLANLLTSCQLTTSSP